MQEMMETIAHLVAQDPEPDPEGGPGGRRITNTSRRTGASLSRRKPCVTAAKAAPRPATAFKEHFAVDVDSKVTREVVVRPANEPEPEAGRVAGRGTGAESRFAAVRY